MIDLHIHSSNSDGYYTVKKIKYFIFVGEIYMTKKKHTILKYNKYTKNNEIGK